MVLIRKDEERMSYAENYFFFNSISKKEKFGWANNLQSGKIKNLRNLFLSSFFVKMRQKYGFLMNVGVVLCFVV